MVSTKIVVVSTIGIVVRTGLPLSFGSVTLLFIFLRCSKPGMIRGVVDLVSELIGGSSVIL